MTATMREPESDQNAFEKSDGPTIKFTKSSAKHGVVIGWAIICTKGGEPFVDCQDNHAPDESMFEAALKYMLKSRISTDMHERDQEGFVKQNGWTPFAFPMTQEIADSLDIITPMTGLLIGMQPSEAVYKQFETGERTGFSIGGKYGLTIPFGD